MSELIPNADGSSEKRQSFPEVPPMIIDSAKTYEATMVTDKGTLEILLDPLAAPVTVNNFVFLARWHYFDGIIVHRVIPGFVLQGGDPTGTGTGGPGYRFNDELPKPGRYELGSLAMANAGPNTNGSQFFIVTGASGQSLPNSYSRFGQVTTGQETLVRLDAAGNADPSSNGVPPLVTHRILSVTIHN